jgi:hypothetical protein
VAVHQLGRLTPEVAVVVRVGEARRRDLGAGREASEFLDRFVVEGAVDGPELVVMSEVDLK